MDSLETLLYEERDGVAIVTLNRPDVHNAFNTAMQRDLQHGPRPRVVGELDRAEMLACCQPRRIDGDGNPR